MPDTQRNLGQLFKSLLDGDEGAACELVERFSGRIRTVIRAHLDARVRPVMDSADVEQQVWGSFFCRELYREALEDPDKLREFLLGIARRKAQMASRDHLRDKRDRRREVPLEVAGAEGALLDRGPGPRELAEKEDQFLRATAHLDERWRAALLLLRHGYSPDEAAQRAGVCVRTLARMIERLRQHVGRGA